MCRIARLALSARTQSKSVLVREQGLDLESSSIVRRVSLDARSYASSIAISVTMHATSMHPPAPLLFFFHLRTLRALTCLGSLGLCALSAASALAAQSLPPLPPPGIPPVTAPPGNPTTVPKALLGKALFWDEQMSATQTVSCGTCHIPAAGGSDPRALLSNSIHPGFDQVFGSADDVRGSRGVSNSEAHGFWVAEPTFGLAEQVTQRRSPSMINVPYNSLLFWDGRVGPTFFDPVSGAVVLPQYAALEAQAAEPPISSIEMAHVGASWPLLVAKLAPLEPLALAEALPVDLGNFVAGKTYAELYEQVYGSPGVTAARTAQALATYERTLLSGQSPYDDFLGGNLAALSAQQVDGLKLYFGPARCNSCHGGQLLSDLSFRNTGVRPSIEDLGRAIVTGSATDNGRFKVPSLRNVALRAPYFHNGSAVDLAAVVEFYDRGGDFDDNLDPAIAPLGLTASQRQALVAFLQSFTDPRVANETAPFDRPRLYAESAHVPTSLGVATAGSAGSAPRLWASEPPALGNPNLTFAIEHGLGGAPTLLVIDTTAISGGWNLLGAQLYVALSAGVSITPGGALSGAGAGNGWTSRSFAVPQTASLQGQALIAQWFVLDAGAAGGLAATQAAQLTLY
jgi:cytochrome c peroxidase